MTTFKLTEAVTLLKAITEFRRHTADDHTAAAAQQKLLEQIREALTDFDVNVKYEEVRRDY